ncbi:MAG TPA: trypsin-like serine protease, partial [Longimicrobium sp.]|nr:trypsin-like serine protease [Longimicrobium sp.]
MTKRWSLLGRIGMVTGLAVLTACSDQGNNPASPEEESSASESKGAGPPAQARNGSWDDRLAALAEQVPGFGGFFQEPVGGGMVVYLTDTNRAAAAKSLVAAFLRTHGAPAEQLVIRQGEYDWRDLLRWRRGIEGVGLQGITFTDVDERTNRVVIGVMDDGRRQAVASAAARLGVPPGALRVERIAPTVVEVTLQNYYRPVQGGLQIQSPGTCTLGYIAIEEYPYWVNYGGPRYAITNSHCTDAFASVTGTTIGQPTLSYPIGYEYSDPPLFTSAQNSDCPPGRNCRHSDAALFRLNDGISSRYAAVTRVSSGLTIGSPDNEAYAGAQSGVWGGLAVEKVGRTTGRSTGTLTSSCANVPQYELDPWGNVYDTGRTMLCQLQANYNSGGGDSGSPVFTRSGGQPYALGIHWGSNGTTRSFSWWVYFWSEFGN